MHHVTNVDQRRSCFAMSWSSAKQEASRKSTTFLSSYISRAFNSSVHRQIASAALETDSEMQATLGKTNLIREKCRA